MPRVPRPLPVGSRDAWFTSQLLCPVVLRRTLQGQRGHTCRCSARRVPEVTDLEYDSLIRGQLCATGQTVIVHVISAKDPGLRGSGLAQVYREQNRSRTMPCIQVSGVQARTLALGRLEAGDCHEFEAEAGGSPRSSNSAWAA